MTYKELEKKGIKVGEEDFYNGNIYLYTREYWVCNETLHIHENHPNLSQYTGRKRTYEPEVGYAKFLINEPGQIREDIRKKLQELTKYE